ncbi:MAG: hypothetical protein AMXMBFR64_53980 [Myxococcales bacterium]
MGFRVKTQPTPTLSLLAAARAHAVALPLLMAVACGANQPGAPDAVDDTAEAPPPPVGPAVMPLEHGPPGTWGAAPEWASPEDVAAMEWVNWARAATGLQALILDAGLAEAARAHAAYVVANHGAYLAGLSLHAQVPSTPGFTGETWVDRLRATGWEGPILGEVIAYQPLAVASVWQWMDSLYHRLPLLGPSASALGYGSAHGEGVWLGVVEVGGQEGPGRLVGWPPKDATDVATAWDGLEVPQPAPPPGGYPSGPVLTVQGSPGQDLRMTAHVLLGPDGPIPHVALDGTSDPLLRDHAAIGLYADQPLDPGVEHRARVDGTLDGVAFTWEWTFTTRSVTGCSPTAQDCPPGRGCYADAGGARCAWHGPVPEGGACAWQNDCLPGTACQGGTCLRWCDADDPAGCAAVCPAAWSPIGSSPGLGVCDAPSCSPMYGGCGGGSTCAPGPTPACVAPGEGAAGSSCVSPLDCAAGTTCADLVGGQPKCMTLCDATPLGPGAAGGANLPGCDACAKGALSSMDGSGIGFCVE